jgi:carboxypeptidase C (cathepsin A)
MNKIAIFLAIGLMATKCSILNAQIISQTTLDSIAETKPEKSVTKHSIKIDGKLINYTATAGTTILKNDKGESIALFGFTAYTKDGEPEFSKRPITFAYNGGPGSSSIWLHMGALGPRRVIVNDASLTSAPPYRVEDNQYSIIDVTDLVMIDPVGTGISHPIGKATVKDFWGVDQDIKSVSQFISQYVTDNERWNSPKFLLGESYGTPRSAGVADYLQSTVGMQMNGVIMVSCILDFQLFSGEDITSVLYLPSYAAVAWYYNKIPNKPADLETFLQEVRTFAGTEYAAALLKGDQLNETEKQQELTKLSSYTGLSKDYLNKANLRVSPPQFRQELMREDHQMVGRYDARFKGITQDLLREYAADDPQSTQITPAYVASFMNYYYGELKVNKSHAYQVNCYNAEGFKWDWAHAKNGAGGTVGLNTEVDLAEAMSKNPNLKVLVFNGYYDLATPFYATEYAFGHLGLDKKIQSNIIMKYFPAGHMMYVNLTSLEAFKKNAAAFILETTK